ncbi:hypothetical protein B0H16DRAFT_1478774 [Mycena metata]|uniref:Apple domain-containing protein n=1 Tax=Mycena metata TaxID=1033252 RepID=A0AAD7MEA8_9AGAR|nr:hypothetical protein B0H16DRAFT_1478774 [Mycena metata]
MFNSKALLAGTLAALAAFASANPTNPAPDATNFWAVYPGWDMADGAGISTSTVDGTELACLAACNADPTCVSYSYQPYPAGTTLSPSCWLKDELDFSAIQTRGFPITLVILGACGTTRALLTHASLPIRSFNVRGPALCFNIASESQSHTGRLVLFPKPSSMVRHLILETPKKASFHMCTKDNYGGEYHEFASTGHACVNIPSDFAPRVFSMRTFSRPFTLYPGCSVHQNLGCSGEFIGVNAMNEGTPRLSDIGWKGKAKSLACVYDP